MTAYRWLVPLCACLAFAGCATVAGMKEDMSGLFQPNKGQKELDAGVKAYEDGDYKEASKQLQASLDAGLAAKASQARAHKLLAFIACVSDRIQQCRDEFNKAFDADPSFALRDDEAGHPVWGPVYRAVKAKRS